MKQDDSKYTIILIKCGVTALSIREREIHKRVVFATFKIVVLTRSVLILMLQF